MTRGNIRLAVLAVAALSVSATHARSKTPQQYCDELGAQLNADDQIAQSKGYYYMNQPIVVADPSLGISEDTARAQSMQKLQEFKTWLDQKQAVVNSSRAPADCVYRTQAQTGLENGYALYNTMMSFPGPYTKSEVALSSSPAAQVGGYYIDLPCRQANEPKNGLRACGEVIRDITSAVSGTAPTGFLQKVVEGIYRGCDLSDASLSIDPQNCKPIAAKAKVETCNYFPGFTDLTSANGERTTNFLGKRCGDWMAPVTSVSGSRCMINVSQMGTIEQSYYQGNMIRAFDCHWAQVKNELASGKLRLTAPAGIKPEDLYKTQIDQITKAKKILLAYKNVDAIENCQDPNTVAEKSAGQQSACMMATHRLILEKHFAHLAALEVVHRAQRSFERFDAGNSQMEFFTAFKSYVQQNAAAVPQKAGDPSCRGTKSQCNPTDYLNNCYKPLWNNFFTSRSNSVWNSGVCR